MSREHELIVDAEDMSQAEKERLASVAKSMTEKLLEATDLLGGIPWGLVHEKHGISLFRADVGNDVPCNVHAVCKFNAEIEDVAESMITSTTDAYKNMMSMLSSDFLDGAVVQNIVEPTELNPHRYVALKWAAFKGSALFGKDRDFIILEYVDMIEDDQGQKVAFRVMESVEVPNNSPYAESPKYTRDIVPLMGFMYHTTKKSGELRLTYTCNFDKNGDLPAWAANSAIQSHVEKCITGILKYMDNFRATKEEIVLPHKVIPMSEQDHCRICEKSFCVRRRKYNCLKCGEVICSNCSSMRNAIVPGVGERQLRVCTACVLVARRSSRSPPTSDTALASPMSNPRAPSTVTVDTDVSSVRAGSSNASVCRTQSFTCSKRRSLDNLLDPVRSRLIEYKMFSNDDDAVSIPKANFPGRSFSDGLIMKKDKLFGAKRRGSPADLAISIEAFRQHQLRMGNDIQQGQPEDNESNDEDTMQQLQQFSTMSAMESAQPTLYTPHRVVLERRAHDKDDGNQYQPDETRSASPTLSTDSRVRLDEAMGRVQGIIEAAQYANNLAQHARKVSHHRVLALKNEHQAIMGIRSDKSAEESGPEADVRSGLTLGAPSSLTNATQPTRVRRTVCQTKNGAVLYGSKTAPASPVHDVTHQVHVVTRAMADLNSNQWVDAGFRRHHTEETGYH